MNVLLIGNGSSVMDRELGSRIDSDEFDVVIRFNRYSTDGYEKYVGTKTNIWVLHDGHYNKITEERLNELDKILFFIPKFKYDLLKDELANTFSEYDKVGFISKDIEDEINRVVNFGQKWPPVGLITITWCLHNFDDIYLYGFDGFSKNYEYFHYFDSDNTRLTSHAWRSNRVDHDLSKENEYLQHLLKNERIHLL